VLPAFVVGVGGVRERIVTLEIEVVIEECLPSGSELSIKESWWKFLKNQSLTSGLKKYKIV
jgi:hypothetical protein